MHGPVALVGSGEFLEVMRPVDQRLLERRPQRAVFLPTAAAEEGDERVAYWLDLGTRHFASMGVEPVPLAVLDRADAQRQDLADLVAGAGLVYLSGGNPGYLADTLRSTAVWQAIVDAWQAGSALAGCSAGACALGAVSDDFRRPGRFSGLGLGVVPHVAAIPHFDRFDSLAPDLAGSLVAAAPDGVTVVGVDEDTALVGGLEQWRVEGRQAVWTIGRTGSRTRYGPDQTVHLPLAPPTH
jgi:cyanophycinase-like exopeptidase